MKKIVGIDLGIRTIACSCGEIYQQPYFDISDERKKNEGGAKNIARKLTRDWLASIATRIVISHDVIYIETLDETVLDSFKDTAFDEFPEILKQKAALYEKKVIEVDQYYASSQICNVCGYKNTRLKDVTIRKWDCPRCGNSHDRDINASINILKKGLEQNNS